MVDRDKHSDEEYHYTDEGAPIEEEEVSSGAPEEESLQERGFANKVLSFAKNRRILVAAGLLVAILVVYYFIAPTGPAQDASFQQAGQQQSQPQNGGQSQEQQAAQQGPQPTQPVADAGMSGQQLQQLQSQQKQSSQKVTAVSNKLQDLQNSINQLSNFSSKLGQAVTHLNSEVKDLKNQQQAWFKKQQEAKAKAERRKKAQLTYEVRAIQPGIAWLRASNGQDLVVKKGDNITGYGHVKMIQPNRGVVAMSNGAVFEYGQYQ